MQPTSRGQSRCHDIAHIIHLYMSQWSVTSDSSSNWWRMKDAMKCSYLKQIFNQWLQMWPYELGTKQSRYISTLHIVSLAQSWANFMLPGKSFCNLNLYFYSYNKNLYCSFKDMQTTQCTYLFIIHKAEPYSLQWPVSQRQRWQRHFLPAAHMSMSSVWKVEYFQCQYTAAGVSLWNHRSHTNILQRISEHVQDTPSMDSTR